ncbi:MAG: protein kinase [Polyangiaceae bacterium]|nr:protein kinase [Polyangiaceae bacterium]
MSQAVLDGRFHLLEQAGKGASGDVFRAHDDATGRTVAVKVLAARHDGDSLDRFSREVRLLSEVDHPHVVGYVAHGTGPEGRPYVAVDWLEGEDLARRQRREPLDGREALEVARQAALGLAALHSRGIVHRDIKPSNLFLSQTAGGAIHLTLIDLGVATSEGLTMITREGVMIGTPSYMSPEQVLGRGAVTSATDLFSLGVVLFELIARERPYRADDIVGLIAKIGLQDPPRLSSVVPGAPSELDALVATAMAKQPHFRFSSALDLARALQAAPPFVNQATAPAAEVPTKTGPLSAMGSTEHRVVTAVFAKLVEAEGATEAWTTFSRLTQGSGGAAHRLLSVVFVAVFGDAVTRGDEPRRAALAALSLRAKLPAATLAVATGRALKGASALSGDALERGASLVDARPGRIRIDSATARLLGDGFELLDDGGLVLLGERAGPARSLLGGATPCVGRARELAQLEALIDECTSEPASRAAVVVGEPGAGKSRLAQELMRRVLAGRAAPRLFTARGNALAEGSPFAMIGAAIRSFLQIEEGEPLASQRDKLGATVRGRDQGALVTLVARLASIDGAPSRGSEDGALMNDQLRGAFEAWLGELARERPVVVLLEDAHHADAPSMRLLDGALGNLSELPLFVLALARPELERRFPKLWHARDPVVMRLGKLGRRASRELATHVLQERASPELLGALVERSGGNPFFLEELLRAVMQPSATPNGVSHLPDTVLGLVQVRLDALSSGAKRTLKAASVFGDVFWAGGVGAVLAEPTARPEEHLQELVFQEIIERRPAPRFHNEQELAFRHGLVREAAYELLSDDDRRVAHGRAGAWLEQRGEPAAAVMARHFELAGMTPRAMAHCAQAAEQALVGGDFDGAIERAAQALAYGATGEPGARLLLTVAEARRWRGDLEIALEAAAFAEEGLVLGTQDWFAALREQIAATGRLGRIDRIGALAARAAGQTAARGAEASQIAALVPAAVHLLYSGDRAAAEALATRVESLAKRLLGLEPRARARVHQLRAALAQARDSHDVAIREQEAALAQFELANDRRAGALVSSNLGFALMQLGAHGRAREALEGALEKACALGLTTIVPLAEQNLGALFGKLGQLEVAVEIQRRALARFVALSDPRLEASSRIHLAAALAAMGELDRAADAVTPVASSSFEPLVVGAHAVLTMIAVRRGEPEVALGHARAAAELLGRLGAIEEFEALARLALVEAELFSGDLRAAREAARAARQRVSERAGRISDPSLRASFLERTPEHQRLAELELRLGLGSTPGA